jgi:hypothetical protein
MDADQALTAVNVCRAVGLFHVHGPEDDWERDTGPIAGERPKLKIGMGWGFKSSKNWDETINDGAFMVV